MHQAQSHRSTLPVHLAVVGVVLLLQAPVGGLDGGLTRTARHLQRRKVGSIPSGSSMGSHRPAQHVHAGIRGRRAWQIVLYLQPSFSGFAKIHVEHSVPSAAWHVRPSSLKSCNPGFQGIILGMWRVPGLVRTCSVA